MTRDELKALFEKHRDEYDEFDRIEHKRSRFKELHALLLLEERFPPEETSMISSAATDEIHIGIDFEIRRSLSEADVIELLRCGVQWDYLHGGLCMPV